MTEPFHQPRKRFGQHFLRDQTILQKMTHAIDPKPEQHLVEIGPGEGVLTAFILPLCTKMDAIEIDRDLVRHLQQRFHHYPQFHVHAHDVLKFDWRRLTTTPHSLRIMGNLPYNISTPLLFNLFNVIDLIQDMHFMLQKEMVLRMTARVGDSNYNRLSVMTQYFCHNERLFDIPPSAFFPPPQVDSAVIEMHPRTPDIIAKSTPLLATLVRTAFNQRRKTIHNAIKTLITTQHLQDLGIDDQLRPQQLTINNFVKISNFLYDSQVCSK
ncbi:MAG: hypothetical protein A3F10_02910 [Coxiella sp. RIFCSPHIGHO2_12_FULL_42_15]|nr:MAG: hypothetical protein A3F10_02910 [Coxiella sp. RIFCSPHIGHO2_12_FULL_42_15]